MKGLRERGLAGLLYARSRPSAVTRSLKRRAYPRRLNTPTASGFRAAAVIWPLQLYSGADEFAGQVYTQVRLAVDQGAELVAFPECVSLGLVGLLPGVESWQGRGGLLQVARAVANDRAQVADLLTLLTAAVRRVHHATFSFLARAFEVMILAGSVPFADHDARVHNVSFLYGADGELIGRQGKTHLTHLEREWGLFPEHNVEGFATPLGRLGLQVGRDVAFYEGTRLLMLGGAEVLLAPTGLEDAPAGKWAFFGQGWARAQDSQMYVVQPALTGRLLDVSASGFGAIYAPLSLSPHADGLLSSTVGQGEDLLLADLDLKALRQFRRAHEPHFNADLYEQYLPMLYPFSNASRLSRHAL